MTRDPVTKLEREMRENELITRVVSRAAKLAAGLHRELAAGEHSIEGLDAASLIAAAVLEVRTMVDEAGVEIAACASNLAGIEKTLEMIEGRFEGSR